MLSVSMALGGYKMCLGYCSRRRHNDCGIGGMGFRDSGSIGDP